jgi:hypothetical protein
MSCPQIAWEVEDPLWRPKRTHVKCGPAADYPAQFEGQLAYQQVVSPAR